MRILHVVTAFPRAPGDIIAPWLIELLRRQRAAGLDVEVFAPAYRGGGNTEFEGIPVHRFRYFPGRWVKSRLPWLKQFLKRALRTSDQVVAISTYTAREIAELVHVPVRVIPYGLGFAESLPGGSAARRSTDGTFQILYVGNLIPRKGVRYLIDALHRLPSTIPAKLLILGEGTDRAKLEAQVHELGLDGRVEMPCRVPEPDLHREVHEVIVLVPLSIVYQLGD